MLDFKTPVHIISGFLGVGKTTTIINLLRQSTGKENIAVIVNEYGEIGIDGSILESEGKPFAMAEVPGGCICCSSGEMLLDSFREILTTIKPTRIIIEPSGLARPSDIIIMLKESDFNDKIEIKPLITIIDPELYCDDEFRDSIVFDDQIESADILVIGRTDLASEQQILRIERDIAAMFPPKLHAVKIQNGQLPFETLLLDFSRKFRFHPPVRSTGNKHEKDFFGFGFTFGDEKFDFEKLCAFFISLPEGDWNIVRAKGIFNTDHGWKILEIAGKRFFQRDSEYRFENKTDFIIPKEKEKYLPEAERQLLGCRII